MYISTTSASRGNTYLDCSFKYFLTYEVYVCSDCGEPTYISELLHFGVPLDEKKCMSPECGGTNLHKLRMPTNWSALNGSIVHMVLELYAQARKEGVTDWRLDWEQNLIDAYFGELKDFNTPDDLFDLMTSNSKNMKIMGAVEGCDKCIFNCEGRVSACPSRVFDNTIRMVSDVIDRYDESFAKKCIGIEEPFEIEIGEYKGRPIVIKGYMDLVLQPDEKTIETIDYKTGTFTKTYPELMQDNQAGIYSMAMKHLYPDAENYFLTFDYFTRSPVTVTFTQQQDDRMKERVIQIFKQVVDNTYPRRIPLCKDGSLFFKCKYMCHRPTCDVQWAIFQERYGRSGL